MSLKIVYGNVSSNGTIHSGSGDFDVVAEGSGEYTVVFMPAFKSVPTVVTVQNYPGWNDLQSSGGNTTDNTVLIAVNKNKCKIKTGSSNGKPDNRNFAFIAIGT